MEDDNTVDPSEPIDNHPDHKKFYLDGTEDSSADIATAVKDAVRAQHDIDDSSDVYVDTVDIDAPDKQFKVGVTIIDNDPIEFAPFGTGGEPNAASSKDVRYSVVEGEHILWAEPNEESETLRKFNTAYTDGHNYDHITPVALRRNEQ